MVQTSSLVLGHLIRPGDGTDRHYPLWTILPKVLFNWNTDWTHSQLELMHMLYVPVFSKLSSVRHNSGFSRADYESQLLD
ncbi:hypothetical protein MHYP_G00291290 [Metynnis hypsauchen]